MRARVAAWVALALTSAGGCWASRGIEELDAGVEHGAASGGRGGASGDDTKDRMRDAGGDAVPDGSPPMEIVELPGDGGICGATSVEAERVVVEEKVEVSEEVVTIAPVAINIMLDQSGSMGGTPAFPAVPALWPGAVDSINAFVNDPMSTGLSVALQYFPVAGFQCSGAGYDTPEVPMAALPGNAAAITASLAAHAPNGNTPIEGALRGVTTYCQNYVPTDPNEKCVAVFITDGAPTDCDLNHDNIASVAATAFAAGVKTYAVGLQGSDFNLLDKISMQGGAEDCDLAATTFACDVTSGSDKLVEALNKIREEIVTTVTHTETVMKTIEKPLECEWVLPVPDDAAHGFDKNEVNVQLTAPGTSDTTLGNVASESDCVEDAWHYDDPATPTRIIACPQTCEKVQSTTGAKIDILLGCPTIITGGSGGTDGGMTGNPCPMLTAPELMCTCGAYGGKGYFFCPGPKDWNTARTLCMAAMLDLAAIESMAEQMFVGMNVSENSWLGATNAGPNSWFWTATSKEFWNMTAVGGAFVNWAPGNPIAAAGLCALMQGATDDWGSLPCSTPSGYVCEQK